MGTIVIDLTFSAPASPQTPPTSTDIVVDDASSSSAALLAPVVVEKEPTPPPRRSLEEGDEERPERLLMKRKRSDSAPPKESLVRSNPYQVPYGHGRSSSMSEMTPGKGRFIFKVQLKPLEEPNKAPEIPKSSPTADSLPPANVADDVANSSQKPKPVVQEAQANPNPNPNPAYPLLITRDQTVNLRMLIEYAKQQKRLGLLPSDDDDDQVRPALPPFLASMAARHASRPPPSLAPAPPALRNPNVAINRPVPETLRLFPEELPLFPMASERRRGEASTSRAAGDESGVDLSVFIRKESRGKRHVGDLKFST